jgi:molybdopterin synthase sulfur carrier subunit
LLCGHRNADRALPTYGEDQDCAKLRGVVQVLYFAALRDLLGLSEEELDIPEGVRTVAEFVQYVQCVRPALNGKMASVRVALDEAFAGDSETLNGVRTIALIPPVAGG